MKILILTQWFDPEPAFKGLPFARELAKRGHEVQVLTGFPNYPGGKLYPNYQIRIWMKEVIDGIEVIRVPLYPSHDGSGFHRALNYISFACSATILGSVLVRRPDVIYTYHPPLTTGLAAWMIGILRRAPFVYDIQDLWPDTVAVSGMMSNRFGLSVLNKLCSFVYRRARRITVLSPGFRERLMERGVSGDKIVTIYNWADEGSLQLRGRDQALFLRRPGRLAILFAGTMGTAQGLEAVLHAAKICEVNSPEVDFVFVGGGVERDRLERMAADMMLSNVRFLPRQSPEKMGGILAQADALLVHLKPDPLFEITIPSKLQAYLCAGKPIILGCSGDAARLVNQSGAGLVCRPGDSESIASAVQSILELSPAQWQQMGDAGSLFYKRELSLAVGSEAFVRVFTAVISTTPVKHSCTPEGI